MPDSANHVEISIKHKSKSDCGNKNKKNAIILITKVITMKILIGKFFKFGQRVTGREIVCRQITIEVHVIQCCEAYLIENLSDT